MKYDPDARRKYAEDWLPWRKEEIEFMRWGFGVSTFRPSKAWEQRHLDDNSASDFNFFNSRSRLTMDVVTAIESDIIDNKSADYIMTAHGISQAVLSKLKNGEHWSQNPRSASNFERVRLHLDSGRSINKNIANILYGVRQSGLSKIVSRLRKEGYDIADHRIRYNGKSMKEYHLIRRPQ